MAQSRSPGLLSAVCAFWRNEDGATAIEYGLLVALIALVLIGAVSAVYTAIVNNFNTIGDKL
jgi:pilus assembly protein Flp/PilA